MNSFALDASTVNGLVFVKLRDLITNGEIPLGERLDERALAQAMGISRTPLREAIGRLANEGLVEHRPYRGNFVRTFTAEQVANLYDVRKTLEAMAIRLAVTHLSDENLDRLRSILDDVRQCLANDDLVAFGEADRRFHRAIAELSRNETLIDTLERLNVHIQMVRTIANRDPDVVARTTKERKNILSALESRDADAAAELIAEHIEGVKQAVMRQFAEGETTA